MLVKERTNERFMVDLPCRIRKSTCPSLYKFFKYLVLNLDHLAISKIGSISQLRRASHRICIETRRWHKTQQLPSIDRTVCVMFYKIEIICIRMLSLCRHTKEILSVYHNIYIHF